MKRALITGASGGIGRHAAVHLGREGWRILAQGRDNVRLSKTVEAVREAGAECDSFIAEMANANEVADLCDWASTTGGLDAVIHCAGSYSSEPVSPDSFENWDRIINEIIRGTMRLTAHTLPAVRATKGTYVFILGPSSWMGMKGSSAYSAARHAQAGFARALFEEVREDQVRVTLIHPGFVNTSLVNTVRVDPERMIQTEDMSLLISTAVNLQPTACVTELTVRPQRSPYR
jgi:3-hydroxy acid dehydrogenase/malonic semialdehyde reductase